MEIFWYYNIHESLQVCSVSDCLGTGFWDICVIIHHQSLIPQREGIFLESESLNSLKNTQTFIELEVYFVKHSQPLDPVLGKESVQAWSQLSLKNSSPVCLSIHKDIQHTKNHSPYLKAVSSICILIIQFVVVTSYSNYLPETLYTFLTHDC